MFFLFRSEITFLYSKSQHENLVQLWGITRTPLRMILEFVPHSDLYKVLKQAISTTLSFKWKLKMAIDCVNGMKYDILVTKIVIHNYYFSQVFTFANTTNLPQRPPSAKYFCKFLHLSLLLYFTTFYRLHHWMKNRILLEKLLILEFRNRYLQNQRNVPFYI